MGVSILMTPGPVGRNFGKQVNITPGLRSVAASILRDHFGGKHSGAMTLVEADLVDLGLLADGASVYTSDNENIWKIIAEAIRAHSAVTIVLEY